MDFKNFAAGRDFFYLAFLLLGAGFGSALNRFRRHSTNRFRNWSVTLAFLFFAGTIAVLAAMLLKTGGKFFTDLPFYFVGGVLALLLLLAVRVPRAVGFPLVLLAGFVFVWIGYSFVQFPRLGSHAAPLAYLAPGEHDPLSIQVIPVQRSSSIELETRKIELEIISMEYASFFPLIGGESRGKITEILVEEKVKYKDIRFERGLMKYWHNLFNTEKFWNFASLEKYRIPLSIGPLLPGKPTGIYFDGSKIELR